MKRLLLLVVCLTAASFVASADPLCSGGFTIVNQSVTNNTIISGNGAFGGLNGCTIAGFDFSNFQVAANTGYAVASSLNVVISSDGLNSLIISTNMAAGQDIELEFSITPGILGMTLGVGPSGGVNEVICSKQMGIGNVAGVGNCPFVGGVTLGSGAVSQATTTLTSFPVVANSVDWVFKDISGASEIFQSITPEPMTLSLMGAGLLGIGIFGRRRFKK
jgi:hypothetical protein